MLLPIGVVFHRLHQYFRATTREVKRIESISRSPIFSSFGETLSGLSTIRAFGLQRSFADAHRRLVAANNRSFFVSWMSSRWLALRLDYVSALVLVTSSLLAVALRDQINAGVAALAITYAMQFTGLLQWTVRNAVDSEAQFTSVERLMHFEHIPREEEDDGQEVAAEADADAEKSAAVVSVSIDEGDRTVGNRRRVSVPTNWPARGAIEFRNVRMRYRPELELVLRGVSASVRAGEKIGIVGRTGAGKSSLMVALFRICELSGGGENEGDVDGALSKSGDGSSATDGGSILIDGIDIAHLPLRALRSRLSIIPQDPVLFSGTLRYNLDPFGERSDAELVDALRRVHLWQSVVKAANQSASQSASDASTLTAGPEAHVNAAAGVVGVDDNADVATREDEDAAERAACVADALNAKVSEFGENWSHGERQLICIARALLRRSQVVVLDEATAAVDAATDALIQRAIRDCFASATVLTIAHRLNTIADADRVMVLDAGRLAEFDTPIRLIGALSSQTFSDLNHIGIFGMDMLGSLPSFSDVTHLFCFHSSCSIASPLVPITCAQNRAASLPTCAPRAASRRCVRCARPPSKPVPARALRRPRVSLNEVGAFHMSDMQALRARGCSPTTSDRPV